MAQRIVEIIVPEEVREDVNQILAEKEEGKIWREEIMDENYRVKILLPAEETGPVLDALNKKFSGLDQFRVIMYAVEATIPRADVTEEEDSDDSQDQDGQDSSEEDEQESATSRISREELYEDITETLKFSNIFVVLIFLSAIVAAFGLIRSDVAIIVGAMVIAPIIGPNMALALGTTLGDLDLTLESLKTNVIGIMVALGTAVLVGYFLKFSPEAPEIVSRTQIGFGDVALALSAGTAGALSFTMGLSTTLIGVMVAVALLPPTVVAGMLLGAGQFAGAGQALLLVINNVICINLSGVATFLVQGIQPMKWWEAQKARKMTFIAISIWVSLLVLLLITIGLMKNITPF